MKKSQEISRKTWRMIAKNLIILAVMAVVAFVGVMSWFSQNTTATADGIHAETKVNDNLEFYIMPPSDSDQYAAINTRLSNNQTLNAGDNGRRRTEWHHGDLTFDSTDQEFKFMSGLFMSEVTGNGTTFKIPKLMQYDQVAYIDTTQAFEDAVANDNYMSFDIYFRSQNSYSIVLTNQSTIEPVGASSLSGQHDYTGDADEADMKPGAIGAVRMSVLNCEASNACELLWIPAPNVWYNGLTDHLYTGLSSAGTGNYSFTDKGTAYYTDSALALRTGESTTDHCFYSSNTATRSKWSTGTNNVKACTAGNYRLGSSESDDIEVVTLSNHDSANGYYYGRIRVNLWIEGEDAEARLRLVNGKFNMSLYFDIKESAGAGS